MLLYFAVMVFIFALLAGVVGASMWIDRDADKHDTV